MTSSLTPDAHSCPFKKNHLFFANGVGLAVVEGDSSRVVLDLLDAA